MGELSRGLGRGDRGTRSPQRARAFRVTVLDLRRFCDAGSSTTYFAGDTALFAEMADLGTEFDIDLALLPVWGYGPNLRGDHMTPRDAAHALTMLRPRLAVPIHWGTFRPLGKLWSRLSYFSDPPYTFAGYAAYLAPDTEVRILQPGDAVSF